VPADIIGGRMNPAKQALARKVLFGIGGLTAVLAVGVGIYNAVFHRPPKFARIVAEDLPADSIGMLAFADPAHGLELVGGAISTETKAELEKQLGFDPFSTSSHADLGFDIDAPIGAALVDLDREIFVITMGITDAGKARETIDRFTEKAGSPKWQDREFAGVDGLWQDQPPAAMLFRGDRLIVVATEKHGEAEVVDVAEEIAKLRARDSLAATDGFRSIHRFPGKPILFGFANTAELGSTMMAAATIGSTEVEAMAWALTSDDRDIHLIWQTIVTADSEYLDYMSGRSRSLKPMDRVPSPVYAGLQWSVDPEYLRDVFDELGALGDNALDEAQHEAERELGVSVANDILGVWTGEFGVLWTGAGEGRWGAVAFAGVRDESAAEATLEQIWSHTDGDEREDTDAGKLHTWDEKPPAQAKIWNGYAWFGIGESRLEQVDDDAEGFRKTTEVDAISDVVRSGSTVIAFADLVEIRKLLRELLDADALDPYADVIEELEAVTMHAEVEGQTFTWTTTLHTTVDDAFDTLITRLITGLEKHQGDSLLDELIPRKAECRDAVDHMIMISSWELPESEQQTGDSLRQELMDKCERGELDAKCAISAISMQELERCEQR
jgi:hypothetical protein